MRISSLFIIVLCILSSCDLIREKEQPNITPWGEVIEDDDDENAEKQANDSIESNQMSLGDIVNAGELIMLTMSGPETYYEYRGHGLGLHYLLCEKFAQKLGVSLRVEQCRDTTEMIKRLRDGEADIIAFPLPLNGGKTIISKAGTKKESKAKKETALARDEKLKTSFNYKGLTLCGVHDSLKTYSWAVNQSSTELAKALDSWFKVSMIATTQHEMKRTLAVGFVKRHIYPFMLNRKDAVISHYDPLFRKYAGVANCDWTLIAAQCYQESCFDPKAKSWAGACGLMQIMPTTADYLGLPRAQLYEPEANIHAACRYMADLQGRFTDVPNRQERLHFALACYNGGYNHIRDAMALAKKYGRNPHRWAEVREFVLGLQTPQYYNDPVVKYGYMRGSETADYVNRIIDRWNQYRGATKGRYGSGVNAQPFRSKQKNKWDKDK